MHYYRQDQLNKQGFQKHDTAREWERDTRIQRKARIRGPTLLQGEGAETESKPALLYFQPWMKEYVGS